MKTQMKMILVLIAVVLIPMGTATAGEFCGENGLISFSFTEGEEIQAVTTAAVGENGTTVVDVYAYLTAVDPVKRDSEAFLRVGAYEFTLEIKGAEGFIVLQELPSELPISLGRKLGNVVVGLAPGLSVIDNNPQLVHWQVLFQGNPKNVVFGLKADGSYSCKNLPGCKEAGTYAIYCGDAQTQLARGYFGAGFVPAYLNFEGKVDLSPRHSSVSWQDLGIFEKR